FSTSDADGIPADRSATRQPVYSWKCWEPSGLLRCRRGGRALALHTGGVPVMAIRVRSLITLMLTLGIALVEVRVGAQTVTAVTSVSVPPKLGEFETAVSSYYKVSARDIAVVRQRRVSDEDLPVVMFVAQQASVAPQTVIDLRGRGYSWWDISV